MTDIEIARSTKLDNIVDIAKKVGIKEEDVEPYGKYKAKISEKVYENLKDKPLGPVFGIKGGATGGGKVQIAPMEDINLHFTGDIHAITAANNLLASLIDNHIYYGNELGFERIVWKRCVDLNDRQLREVETGLSGEKKIVPRHDKFDITVASEIMAIVCLASDLKDLKERLGNILIGYNKQGEPIYAKQLKAEGAMTVLLKDALKPNLVQTLEHTPAIIHGGPFANIAHGCNSITATRLALKLGDYVVTEAGFGADLGAEKFIDIKCRKAGIKPDAVVLVATIKAIKYHGGVEKDKIQEENIEGIERGIDNLYRHIDNLKNKFGLNVIVALNRYIQDTEKEIEYLQEKLAEKGVELSLVEGWAKGGEGARDIAEKLVNLTEKEENNFSYMYELEDSIQTKIEKIATKIYGAKGVDFSEAALAEIKKIEELGYGKFPVCIAKTQYSFSDDAKNLECKGDYNITIRDIQLKTGAGFVVALAGKIMTMPGLPKVPSAESIDIDENGEIVGIF